MKQQLWLSTPEFKDDKDDMEDNYMGAGPSGLSAWQISA